MTPLNFDELSKEVISILKKEQTLVFATSLDGKVTARVMAHVNDGLDIYFGTSNKSLKYKQLKANPNVALVAGSLQIEATAADYGHPTKNPAYQKIYYAKFPQYAGQYPSADDDVVIQCVPEKITVYKFIGKPCWDVLDLKQKAAYRI